MKMKTSPWKHEEVPDLLVMRADAVWTSCEQQHWSVHSRVYTSCPASCCSTGSAPRLDVPTCSCWCERVGPTTCCCCYTNTNYTTCPDSIVWTLSGVHVWKKFEFVDKMKWDTLDSTDRRQCVVVNSVLTLDSCWWTDCVSNRKLQRTSVFLRTNGSNRLWRILRQINQGKQWWWIKFHVDEVMKEIETLLSLFMSDLLFTQRPSGLNNYRRRNTEDINRVQLAHLSLKHSLPVAARKGHFHMILVRLSSRSVCLPGPLVFPVRLSSRSACLPGPFVFPVRLSSRSVCLPGPFVFPVRLSSWSCLFHSGLRLPILDSRRRQLWVGGGGGGGSSLSLFEWRKINEAFHLVAMVTAWWYH